MPDLEIAHADERTAAPTIVAPTTVTPASVRESW
jgi:hypothetical protein